MDEIHILPNSHLISMTDRFKNGDKTDAVYTEILKILKDDFNLSESDVCVVITEGDYPRIYKKVKYG